MNGRPGHKNNFPRPPFLGNLTFQQKALDGWDSKSSFNDLANAQQILVLYPVSTDPKIAQEARGLSSAQAEISSRVRVIQRLRYNHWATKQIEKAINGYHKKGSSWSPKKENPILIKSLVDNIGSVDPVLLEPAVLELYNYVIDLTKGSISEKDKVDLAKQLTDSNKVKRKSLGEF